MSPTAATTPSVPLRDPDTEGEPPSLPPPARRPRERLRAEGPGILTDAELLTLVLGSGVAGRSAFGIARRLARHPPVELARWTCPRWLRVPGIGLARGRADRRVRARTASL